MVVRGAPAIGVTAAFGVVLAAKELARTASSGGDFMAGLNEACETLAATRPTAVNLFWAIARMKKGVMIINTSRGALIDSRAAIEGLKSEKIGYLGIDVYEEEEELFFEDKTFEIRTDDVFARLTTFPNVVITGHQAYFTEEAVSAIAGTTLENISAYQNGEELVNAVNPD